MALDGYTATYDSGEITEVVIDFIMEFGVQIVAFASLVALVALYVWGKNSMK